jgi:hypothetical protein
VREREREREEEKRDGGGGGKKSRRDFLEAKHTLPLRAQIVEEARFGLMN